uniref:Putative secreted protein n=1 Tax=Ixodes ricinus TaxID=34613 RepID=A0A6B0TT33_IXORI
MFGECDGVLKVALLVAQVASALFVVLANPGHVRGMVQVRVLLGHLLDHPLAKVFEEAAGHRTLVLLEHVVPWS